MTPGGTPTVKLTPLLESWLADVTTTSPVVAPTGTLTVILVSLQLCTVALVPLNVAPPNPCDVPKPLPLMMTAAPTCAAEG